MEVSIRPLELLRSAQASSCRDFVRQFEADHVLLIKLPNTGGEAMAAVLDAHPTDGGRRWSVREDDVGTEIGALSLTDVRERLASMPPPSDGSGLAWVLEEPHYAMPLRKRPDATEGDSVQISVGRSTTNDVVLQHPSVSKHHALLEYDDFARFYVMDRGSANFTKVRARIVEPEMVASFLLGEEIYVGDVSLRVVATTLLWEALNIDRPGS